MIKHTSVVELNGHRYDAVSGQIIGAAKGAAVRLKTASGSIDGFVRSKTVSLPPRKVSRTTGHTTYRQAQRSKTLMRTTVEKPSREIHEDSTKKIESRSQHRVDSKRYFRAKTVPKNDKIIKFNEQHSKKDQSANHKTTLSGEVLPLPLSKLSEKDHHSNQVTDKPLPSLVTSVSHQKLERLLDHALANADSHKKIKHVKRSRIARLFHSRKHLAVFAVLLVAILGIFAWQRVPQLSVRLAGAKSHVKASTPTYVPPGFAMAGHAISVQDKVMLSFKSKDNPSKTFTLSQRSSNMDSTAMASTLLPAKSQVQTSQVNGTTVYIYDNDNDAMWVNHGVHYQLHDKANLDSNEVLKIAQSL